MIAQRTFDIKLINSIMFHPEIFDCVSEDNQDVGSQEFDVNADCWVSMMVDDKCIGVYNMHPLNSATLEAHAHILPEYRKAHSNNSIVKMFEWILNECPEMYQKFIVNIPSIYPNVKRFCLRNGFTNEGVNRLSHRKNGDLCDIHMLGITKPEIERFLNVKD